LYSKSALYTAHHACIRFVPIFRTEAPQLTV
jgi:hypothetical protein